MRHDHGDGATMAGGFEGFVCHLNPGVKWNRKGQSGTGTGALMISSKEVSEDESYAICGKNEGEEGRGKLT